MPCGAHGGVCVSCPITFVKVKVTLEDMNAGQILEVRLNGGESAANVPRSLKEEGHKVLELAQNEDGTYRMFVEKGDLSRE